MIFTLHCTFSPFLSLPSTGRWAIFVPCYLFISSNYYLLLTQAQSAYLYAACTACLPTRSLLVQYIRTLWTLTFSS